MILALETGKFYIAPPVVAVPVGNLNCEIGAMDLDSHPIGKLFPGLSEQFWLL